MATRLAGARLFDGTGREPTAASVQVDGATISAIDGSGQTSRRSATIDLDGLTLLPGLINAHTHLGGIAMLDSDRMTPATVAAWTFEHCRRVLHAGYTTCREVGGLDGGVVEVIDAGLVEGPRILPAGPLIVQTGGHGDFRPSFDHHDRGGPTGYPGLADFAHVADGVDAVRAAARTAFRRGARFLKICVTGGVTSTSDEIDDLQFSVGEIAAAVEEAAARGTYVTAHAHTNHGIRRALEAGVTCFEHVTLLDLPTAELLRRHDAAVVPTLTIAHTYHDNGFLPESMRDRAGDLAQRTRDAVRVAHDAGLLVGCGSDLLGPDQRQFGLEIGLLADIVGAEQALLTATRDNARVLRLDHAIGTVEVGKHADLVAVDGDPLADPHLFDDPANIRFVMKDGVVVRDPR